MQDEEFYDEGPGPRRSVQMSLRIDPDVYTEVRRDARTEAVSLNEWVARAVQERLIRKAARRERQRDR